MKSEGEDSAGSRKIGYPIITDDDVQDLKENCQSKISDSTAKRQIKKLR